MAFNSPPSLSYSALSLYTDCGEKYRLRRGYKINEDTWFATVAGSAIHEITEQVDRAMFDGLPLADAAEMAPDFQALFDDLLAKLPEGTVARASGKELKNIGTTGGPNKKDHEWWLHYGPIYVQRYLNWRADTPWEQAVLPGGVPGIECRLDMGIGGEHVVGFIDRVWHDPETGDNIVMDLKTGQVPSGFLQLATYSLGLRELGVEARWGCFWTPAAEPEEGSGIDGGRLGSLVDLDKYTKTRLHQMYASARRGIEAGVFLPHVTGMCGSCGVRDYCWAVAGKLCREIPTSDEITSPTTGEILFPREEITR
jgi:hypothetical protein